MLRMQALFARYSYHAFIIERSFRTDEEECFFRLDRPAKDHLQLNTWYQSYLHTYNTIRPHMGINMLTPKEAIALYLKS